MKPRVIKADWDILKQFTRTELKDYARHLGVPVGSNKDVTILHLVKSGKATITATLGS